MTSVALGEIAQINPRLRERPGLDESVSFLPMAGLRTDGTTQISEERPYGEVSQGYTPFLDGDLLIAKITPCFQNKKIGQAAIPHRVGMGSTEFHVVRPHPQVVDTRYLLHFLRRDEVRVEGERRMTGSGGQRRVPADFLRQLSVPVPPLNEQRRITAILDQTYKLLTARERLAARQAELGAAIFRKMFGEPTWPTRPLGELLDFLTSGSRGWARHYAESGELFLRIQNVKNERLDLVDIAYVDVPNTAEARRTRVRPGDVLLSITADLGRVAVVPDSIPCAYINQHLSILRSSRISPTFLAAHLASPAGQLQIKGRNRGGVKAGLNFDDIRSFEIPLPPCELQEEFTRRLGTIEEAGRRAAAHEAAMHGLCAGLQDRAFSGRL